MNNKCVYIVFIDVLQSQPVDDVIDSIWTSKTKAYKRRDELEKVYDDEHVIVMPKFISK